MRVSSPIAHLNIPTHLVSYTTCLIFLLVGFAGYSQSEAPIEDSTETEEEVPKNFTFYHFSLNEFYTDTFVPNTIDTNLTNFFNYNQNLYNYYNNLGNYGSAQQSLLASDTILTGLNYGFDNFNNYRFGFNTIRFRELSQPFATITYLNGAQQEEGLDVDLSQNIRENWNVGVRYRRISSNGFYDKQRNSINNFQFTQHFKTKNHKYQFLFYGVYNDNVNQSNGGIKYDTVFTDSPQKITRQGFEINYQNAFNSARQQEYFFKQRFNFGPTKKFNYIDEQDSIYVDSIILEQTIPKITLEHTFLYQHQELIFEDKNLDSTNYLNQNLLNGSATFDKTLLNKFDNELAIILHPFTEKDSSFLSSIRLKAGAGFQYGTYTQYNLNNLTTDAFHNNLYTKASLYNRSNSIHHFNLTGQLVMAGYNEGDISFRFKHSSLLKNKIRLNTALNTSSQRPALIFDEYNSFGWNWNTSFNKVGIINGKVELQLDSAYFKMGVFQQSTTNYTYFGIDGLPRQYNGTISITRPYLEKLFKFGAFHLRLSGGYQYISQAGIINLPELFTYNSFYVEGRIFERELLFRLGTDFFYISEHTADRYNPVTRQFFIQTKQSVGNYPWLEPFLMVNVERFYFFVRMANVAEGFFGYNYLARPNYPMQDRALKLSVRWDLIN